MIWLLTVAHAGSIAGLGVPGAGGGFSHPGEHGVFGVIYMPTASVLGPQPEVLLDVGLLGSRLGTKLDSWKEPLPGGGISPVPSLVASVPLGPVGFGATFHVPYARSGDGDPEGPQRFYSVASNLRMLEQDLTGAVRPVDWLALGAGLRIGEFTYGSTKQVDTAAMLNPSLGLDPPLPVGDPLLEGTQTIDGISDVVFSYIAGVALVSPFGHQLAISYRPSWKTNGSGSFIYDPSNDLAAQLEGEIELELVMPPSLSVGGRIALGRVTVLPEVEWVGWKRTSANVATVSGLALVADDPLLDGLLGDAGVDGLLSSQGGEQGAELHWNSVVNAGLAVNFAATSRLDLRAGLWYSPGALQVDWISPSNLDFGVLNPKIGARVDALPALTIAATGELLLGSTRVVTNSKYDQVHPETPAQALPNANGRYTATLWRAGLSLILRLPEPKISREGA